MGEIVLRLDRVMADRKMSLKELSEKVGVSNVNLSKIKPVKSVRYAFRRLKRFVKHLTVSQAIF